jgi:hypothetical protein
LDGAEIRAGTSPFARATVPSITVMPATPAAQVSLIRLTRDTVHLSVLAPADSPLELVYSGDLSTWHPASAGRLATGRSEPIEVARPPHLDRLYFQLRQPRR